MRTFVPHLSFITNLELVQQLHDQRILYTVINLSIFFQLGAYDRQRKVYCFMGQFVVNMHQ